MDHQNDTKELYLTQRKKGIITDESENSIIKKFEFIPDDVYIMNLATTKGNTFLLSTQGILYSWGSKSSPVLGRNAVGAEALKPGVVT
jgi:alpha-tubulin suppressor-like RCC1 family protein